jgi:hypothetical protein
MEHLHRSARRVRPNRRGASSWSLAIALALAGPSYCDDSLIPEPHPPNVWVKLSPLAAAPPSPRLGYEGDCRWIERHGVLLRYGGHNQGGGGEQGSEVWTFEPRSGRWKLHEPNTSPPGICCGQQNAVVPDDGLYIRFPAFSGSHGWQWRREIYLNDASVWTYDLGANSWRSRRPLPSPRPRPLRAASWDDEHQVAVLFGGEGSHEGTLVYDPHLNAWHWMRPDPQPEFRSGGNMAYDAARRIHILFGSQFSDDPHTWAYDLARNQWRDLKPELQPPTDQNDAVIAYDARRRAIIAIVKIAIAKQSEGEGDDARSRLETWAFDAGLKRWRKMDPAREPDASGNRARQLSYAPGLDLILLENRTHPPQGPSEQQIWSYRLSEAAAPAAEPLAPPVNARLKVRDGAVELSWDGSAGAGAEGYAIFRGAGEAPWTAKLEEIARVDASTRSYIDRGAATLGAIELFYSIRAAGAAGALGEAGARLRSRPPLVVGAAVSVLASDRVEVEWAAPEGGEALGYLVERAAVEVYTEDQLQRLKRQTPPLETPSAGAFRRIGRFEALTPQALRATRFVDSGIDLAKPQPAEPPFSFERDLHDDEVDAAGKPYRFAVFAYRIRAVNALGQTGGPSPAIFTIPPAPQHVFSKEDGEACELKWQPAAGGTIAGYRVYRMDGRYDKDPIRRLTPEPIEARSFRDHEAGRASRRYHVVAVDRLGQEGFPSAPVWFQREWRSFYAPFTGEWHQ